MKKPSLKTPRMTGWVILTLLLMIVIYHVAPQQLAVSLYKLSLVTMAGVIGYWFDRSAFPYARPDCFLSQKASVGGPCVPHKSVADGQQIPFAAAMLRRAIIMGAAMLAASLGA